MQLRCTHCHRPFALKRDDAQAALEYITAEDLQHYNAHCPHCGKITRVSRRQLTRAVPARSPEPTPEEHPETEVGTE
ncbi:MAG: hypothetical protein AB1345_01305 [Chloroflexota bacterium]